MYEFVSKNMSYIFHVEYFEGLDLLPDSFAQLGGKKEEKQKQQAEIVKERNLAMEKFSFPAAEAAAGWKMLPDFHSFCLYTCYPGLMVGLGGARGLTIDGTIDCGFTFDYVTGIPYIPGSELKGALRSNFPGDEKEDTVSAEYENYIRGLLNKKSDINIMDLKDNIFENGDVFLGGYPVVSGNDRTMILMESITPHKDRFKNPIPLSMLKVKPDVKFEFCFLLRDYVKDGEVLISAKGKLELFKSLIIDMGVGAKTNVGFGRFAQKAAGKNNFIAENENYGGKKIK